MHAGQWQEYCADRTAALCSSKYAEGGIEFMITCMQLDTVLGYVIVIMLATHV